METPKRNTNRSPRPKLWTPVFVLIVGLALFCFVVGQAVNAGTSVYIDLRGGTALFSGLLAAVFSIAAGAARLVCGPVIDSKGRAFTMTIGAAFLVAGSAGPLVSDELSLFVAYRILQGIGFSAVTTAAATAAADVLPYSRLGEGIGYYGLGQALAMSIGPALGLFLVSTDAPGNLYFGCACISAAALVLTLFCRYERNPEKLPETSVFRMRWEARQHKQHDVAISPNETAEQAASPQKGVSADAPGTDESIPRGIGRVLEARAVPGALPMAIISPAFGFGIFFIGLYGTSIGIGNAGLFFTVSAISMIIVRLKSDTYMDRVAPIKVFGVSVVCGIIAYLLLFASEAQHALFYLAGIFYGVCLGVSMPISQSVAVKNTPSNRWGAANALYLLATDIGIGLSCLAWGAINDIFGFAVTLWCVIACIAASFIVAWIVYPKEEENPTP
ncbi:MFS transporter [Raoultibacter massiliensis]|uniref:MFS transporter n=1 Tax=Raoultibacter massiliensis TaxID=1852371 RepID=UPI000C81B2AF|nr:MFS transporter [Raoultibacter massiliensis]